MALNRSLIRDWRCFVRDNNGAAALIFALAFPVMMGFAGLAIEVGSWFLSQRAMQGAADAAAVSAATAWSVDPAYSPTAQCPTNVCINEALSVAGMNGWTTGNGITVKVYSPPVSGQYVGNLSAVQVSITRTGTNWFSAFLPTSYTAPTLGANSVALAQPGIDCMLSLNATAGVLFTLGGTNMPNCSIGDNSTTGVALALLAAGSVKAYSATVVGGISQLALGGFEWTKTPISGPAPPGPPTPDPYACPGNQCRTMPTPTLPGWLTPLATHAVPTTCTGTITGNSIPGGCSQGISASGNLTLSSACGSPGACVIMSPFTTTPAIPGSPGHPGRPARTTYNAPAINVTNGTLTISGNGYLTILGGNNEPAIQVTGGTLNLATGTNFIQGGTNQPGIQVTGGRTTITATVNSVLGGRGQPGVNITGGRLTFATGTVTNIFEGGTNGAGIQVSGGTLSINAATNNVLAGRGSYAIWVPSDGEGQLTFGNGNYYVQGAQANGGAKPAMLIQGSSNVVFGNGTGVFGGPVVTPGVPAVDDQAGFQPGSGQGLTLGSGNYTFMEGISVTGGDLTLNPPGTSAGVGYYIMVGGGNILGGGFNMTFGELNGSNATIVLTGGAADNIDASDYASINYNGANGITLTAPTTGPTAGIAFFQDRNATSLNLNTFSGGTFGNITGAIYTPNQPIIFDGLGVMNSRCLQMIASTITIAGPVFMNDDCDGTGTAPIISNGSIVLVQ